MAFFTANMLGWFPAAEKSVAGRSLPRAPVSSHVRDGVTCPRPI